ncbi:MAG: hypothetical protein WC966_05690 [Bradymonadales bacterium]|jgi:antitoxin component YwqK of YwqJK toxin-antitoxin module
MPKVQLFSGRFSLYKVILYHLLFALLACSCASQKNEAENQAKTASRGYQNPGPSKRYDNEAMIVKPFDINNDRIIDMWKIYAYEKELIDVETPKLLLIRKEVDSNFDGKVDMWMYYNANENLIKEELDTSFTGNVDRVLYYNQGQIMRSEAYTIDANREDSETMGDASHRKPNIIKSFRHGVLTRVEKDNNADGIIDEWEIYDEEGQIVQVGEDTTGDGKVDTWRRYKAME